MKKIFLISFVMSLLLLMLCFSSFANQTYYYSYTIALEEPPFRELEYPREPITVRQNQEGNYIVDTGYSSVTLTPNDDGSYYGMTQYVSYILNNDKLTIVYDDTGADIFSLVQFTGGWVNCDDKWYYLGTNGKTVTNQWVGNYYLGIDGVMLTNTWTPDGYYVGADGSWTGQSSSDNNSQNSQAASGIKDPVGTYIEDDGVILVNTLDEDGPLIGYVEISKNIYGVYDVLVAETYKGAPYGTVDYIYTNMPFYITSEYKNYIHTRALVFDGYDTITVSDEDNNVTVYHRITDDIRNHINYNPYSF